jgi:6-phospho-beta-glucosidase
MALKLAIVGGGSVYTPELIHGLINRHERLPFAEICLIDIDPDRVAVVAGMVQRMLARVSLPIPVSWTTERRRGLAGAHYVNSLIRVGGMAARSQDERIPLKYNIIGQETTGPGGMMKALRTIPVMLELAHDMEAVCPDAWLINYSNPSGIVAEALGKHSKVRFMGLCSGPRSWMASILQRMGVDPARASVDWVGLNHLSFATRIWVDGQDVTAQAVDAVADHWAIDADWLRALGVIPASYLHYFYHHTRVVQKAQQPDQINRAEQIKPIEAQLLAQYADPGVDTRPELLSRRGGGGYADLALDIMHHIHANTHAVEVVNVPNQGAVDGLPADASVEISCVVDQAGAHPIRYGELPLSVRGLVQAVKAYESLTIEAAVEGSRAKAAQALMAHPLVPSWEVAKPLLDELLAANRPWLPWLD